MNDFIILTDSSADLPAPLVADLNVEVLPLSFLVKGNTYANYPDDREMSSKEFYEQLRGGEMVTTSAVNVDQFETALKPHLAAGKDVLVLAFSSGLSATYQSAQIAVNEMQEKYPAQKVICVDTLCASLGQGLIVWHACQQRAAGKTIDEVAAWAETEKLHFGHWFTVADLFFLKRGGRVSAATALVGTMLSIKPVLHVDNEGRLIAVGKARGRAASLVSLVDHMQETAVDPEHNPVFISHGDCLEDAESVAADIRKRFGTKTIVIHPIGPVIGAHAGPGCVALFFLANGR